jgi:hypothetical protein
MKSKTHQIIVNAYIVQKRWNEKDEKILVDKQFSAHYEIDDDNQESELKKYLSFNDKSDDSLICISKIPKGLLFRLQNDDNLDFDELYDDVKKINTQVIKQNI